jgi:hypothetical protein
MSDGLIVSGLVMAVLLGVGGAAFLVMRSPAFWGEVVKELILKAWPQIKEVLTKRMDPKTEQAWRDCIRRGGEWDHVKKRCKR